MQEAASPWVGSHRRLFGRVSKNAPPIRKLLKIVAKSSPTGRPGAGAYFARRDARAVSGGHRLGPNVTVKPRAPATPAISAGQRRDR